MLSVLTIDSAVRALHEGAYTCSASNGVGPSPNSSAALTVQGTAGDTSTTQHQMHCRPATPSQLHHIALQVSAHQETMLQTTELLSHLVPFCLSPSVLPTVQAVRGRIVGIQNMNVTLSFTISDAFPEVQTGNIQWTFRGVNRSSLNIPTDSTTSTFSDLMGVFSGDRLNLTLLGLNNDFEGIYTLTATNEAGSDSAVVDLVIEGQCCPSLVTLVLCLCVPDH